MPTRNDDRSGWTTGPWRPVRIWTWVLGGMVAGLAWGAVSGWTQFEDSRLAQEPGFAIRSRTVDRLGYTLIYAAAGAALGIAFIAPSLATIVLLEIRRTFHASSARTKRRLTDELQQLTMQAARRPASDEQQHAG